jgi:hypothetical protein
MSKRDTDTELWNEDWFLNLEGKEQLFWFYIKDRCDHAGLWRPNFKMFENISGYRINQTEFIQKCNTDKKRVAVLENGKWLLIGFIPFQYPTLNLNNNFHKSVYRTVTKNLNNEESMTYKFEVKETSGRPLGDLNKEQETKKKNKEGCREKKETENKFTPQYRIALDDFREHRIKLRKPMTEKAVELFVAKVKKLAPENEAAQIELINNAIVKGWQTVWPDKDNTQRQTQTTAKRNETPAL